jgi:hypothetical protein
MIPYKGLLTVEESLQLVEQLNQPVEAEGVVAHAHSGLPSQQDQLRRRASPTGSGCEGVGYRINSCENRIIYSK